MIWAAIALAVFAVAVLAAPALRAGQDAPDRNAAALAIFKDQLAEVDRDAARGQISASEAEAARTEIKRRMLGASRATATPQHSSGRWIVLAFAMLVPVGGAVVYSVTGSPTVPSMPFAERATEQSEAQDLQVLVTRLRTQLDNDPEGGEARGWELLATTYMNMNRFTDAAYAFEKIIDRPEANSATWSQYAESLIAAENGTVTPKAAEAIGEALGRDPSNPAGTFYLALQLEQSGKADAARQRLIDRMADEGAYANWMPAFVAEANRIGQSYGADDVTPPFAPLAGPTREDVETAQEMAPEDQQAFIESMVTRLAERLEDEPDDLQGWLQLARAYAVLNRRDDAMKALQSAQPLTVDLPTDDPMRRAVEAGLEQLGQ